VKPVDVLIVGGGPAGLATAIAASRKGLRAAVIDFRKPPIDKTCGEGLLPPAIVSLGSLGLRFESSRGFPFTSICFADAASSATAPILSGGAIGLRRRDLHRLLVERAEAERVSLHWGTRISGIQAGGVWAQGAFHRCRWLIGADGEHSAVRNFAGLDSPQRVRGRFGFRRHFAVTPWSGAVEVHWTAGVQLIVTPTGAEEICVVVLGRDPRMRIEKALESFPEIARRLRGAPAISRESGTTTCLRRARAVVRGNVALIGDASCTMDGISGHGLSLAFEQALALADALANENLAEYHEAHKRITKMPVRMTKLLLTLDRSPALRGAVLWALARNPALFSKLIALHTGSSAIPHRTGDERAENRREAALACRLCEPN
jgi:2-polyprenyl-6-methoxyphenol hydroxylase-like FAD-dependent oxidoreductase